MHIIKTTIYSSFFILAIFLFTACERVIDIDLRDDICKLVIEANITDQMQAQTITLNKNVSFSTPNEYPAVSGADIKVLNDNGEVFPFKESAPGVYTSEPFAGKAGESYHMSVMTGGKTYQASSKMPSLVSLDSIVSVEKVLSDDENERRITIRYKDQSAIQNQYRFVLQLNDTLVKQVYVTNDRLTEGRDVTYYFMINDDDLEISIGDTVTVEMQCIDQPMYTYWYTLAGQESSGGPGGGVSPSNPPTNIKPAVLGYFSAHTTETKTIVVK